MGAGARNARNGLKFERIGRFSNFLCLFDLFFNFKGSLLSVKMDISYISSLFEKKIQFFEKITLGGAHI